MSGLILAVPEACFVIASIALGFDPGIVYHPHPETLTAVTQKPSERFRSAILITLEGRAASMGLLLV
jgi:hypothetical protein